MSDHGEELNEHGKYFHGRTLYDETIRIPLFIRAPGNDLADKIENRLVSLVDVPPTLLHLAKLPLPKYFQGRPVPPFAPPWDRPIYAQHELEDLSRQAIRTDRWKLILSRGQKPELYDIVEDPAEKNNLAEQPNHRKTLKRLSNDIAAYRQKNLSLRKTLRAPSAPSRPPSDELLKSLRDLGYIR